MWIYSFTFIEFILWSSSLLVQFFLELIIILIIPPNHILWEKHHIFPYIMAPLWIINYWEPRKFISAAIVTLNVRGQGLRSSRWIRDNLFSKVRCPTIMYIIGRDHLGVLIDLIFNNGRYPPCIADIFLSIGFFWGIMKFFVQDWAHLLIFSKFTFFVNLRVVLLFHPPMAFRALHPQATSRIIYWFQLVFKIPI